MEEGAWQQAVPWVPGPASHHLTDERDRPTWQAGEVTVAPGGLALGLEDQAEAHSYFSLSRRKPFSKAALPTISCRPREQRPQLATRAGAAAEPVLPKPAAQLRGQRGARLPDGSPPHPVPACPSAGGRARRRARHLYF